MNGDGAHDLAIGAVFENFDGVPDAGKTYVVDPTVTSVLDESVGMPNQLRVYGAFPNPTRGAISLIVEYLNREETVRLSLVDMAARHVAASVAEWGGATDHMRTFDWMAPAHLPSGTYILRVEAGHQATQIPLVIQR
jgi:hypothetical protein